MQSADKSQARSAEEAPRGGMESEAEQEEQAAVAGEQEGVWG